MARPSVFLLSLFAVLVVASGAGARTLAADGGLHRVAGGVPTDSEFVPGEVVVQFRSAVSRADRARVLARRDAVAVRALGRPGLTLVRLDGDVSISSAIASFERAPNVAFAEPNYVYRIAQTVPNDPDFGLLWGLNQAGDHDIDAPEAWDTQTGSSNVIVAVIDSGVAYDHPELNDNIWVEHRSDPATGSTTTATASSTTRTAGTSSRTTMRRSTSTATARTLPGRSAPRATTWRTSPASTGTCRSCP